MANSELMGSPVVESLSSWQYEVESLPEEGYGCHRTVSVVCRGSSSLTSISGSSLVRQVPQKEIPMSMVLTGRQRREFNALEKRFRRLGIDTSQFGFYDERAFQMEEKRDPSIIESYARWVSLRPRDEAYDQRVRFAIPKLTQILAAAFKTDSLEGGCIGAASMLPAMLNRLGIWSFGVVGSLILEVSQRNLRRTLTIIDIKDFPNAALGHAWVVAPPFHLVDSTIALQHWSGSSIHPFIPECLAVEDAVSEIVPTLDDMVGPDYQKMAAAYSGGYLDPNLHHKELPWLAAFNDKFPAYATTVGDLRLRYCPSEVKMADQPLEKIMSEGSRRSAIAIWNQVVEPAFQKP